MRKRTLIVIVLFILLTTISSKQHIFTKKFNLKNIQIENNSLVSKKDIRISLIPLYDKNLLFLDNNEIEKLLKNISFVESFEIKKKYPNTLKVKIFEKKPIAILFFNKKKFIVSEKIDLIEYQEIKNLSQLPFVFGNVNDFKIFYNDLKQANFPLEIISKYIFYDSSRWDLETINKKKIKLPQKNYVISLKNFLDLKKKSSFEKYELFDYRIKGQLILK
tara:strand:- start:791 stop:1447 length:657 start_codon:yes stop_codon:yes gene_type:complete